MDNNKAWVWIMGLVVLSGMFIQACATVADYFETSVAMENGYVQQVVDGEVLWVKGVEGPP